MAGAPGITDQLGGRNGRQEALETDLVADTGNHESGTKSRIRS